MNDEAITAADALMTGLRQTYPTGAADLDRLLDIHAAIATAGCPWGCNGHNQPAHNKADAA